MSASVAPSPEIYNALADRLTRWGIDTVAMESTGVYWIPLFELLSERGFEGTLVDPRQLKNVPGRKTDVLDCQWIQPLQRSASSSWPASSRLERKPRLPTAPRTIPRDTVP